MLHQGVLSDNVMAGQGYRETGKGWETHTGIKVVHKFKFSPNRVTFRRVQIVDNYKQKIRKNVGEIDLPISAQKRVEYSIERQKSWNQTKWNWNFKNCFINMWFYIWDINFWDLHVRDISYTYKVILKIGYCFGSGFLDCFCVIPLNILLTVFKTFKF